ncbi:sensor histidine kinase [Sedimentimonas flavescens]|uniref:sensor histidine kinase n=1 Tax=Sedimentimonas flavescens TaxID=2851012 RepID=UPI001F187622|nr:ATP-binding protein [Sedimentimonas flavescens]
MEKSGKPFDGRLLGRRMGVGLWLSACFLALGVIWLFERSARIAELTAESDRLQARVSQRADQHAAHMTALSAIAIAGAGQRPDLFRDVAGAIMQFYPRITGIALIPLGTDTGGIEIGMDETDLRDLIRAAARESTGAPVLVPAPWETPAYMIVKRSPNTDAARYGLALAIDARALLEEESGYWEKAATTRMLSLPDGTPILAEGPEAGTPQFAKPLSSSTQPLRLETSVALNPTDLLPPTKVALVIAVLTLVAFASRVALRQRARVRAAERRAELSGMETRLSHASRVNALGEMASGMAHELTQPLTAILAQAQAARRLATRGDTGKVSEALEEIIAQTRRASAILERLRTWTRPHARRPEAVDVRDCVAVAVTLLGRQAEEIATSLVIRMPDRQVPVLADRIELEQVIFNLVRNALDAVEGIDGDRIVTVTLLMEGHMAHVDVQDTGPGVQEDIRDSLFSPFVTTRDAGTGLGLALSHRLVARAGGDLELVHATSGARFRVSLPLAQERHEAAE